MKIVKDTHLLLLLPEGISLEKLAKLLNEKGIKGLRNYDWAKDKDFWKEKTSKSEWVLIPKFPLPGMFSKDYAEQEAVLATHPNYRTSRAIELFTGAVLNLVANNERIYAGKWGWCSDESTKGNSSVRVGGGIFIPSGFRVDNIPVVNSNGILGRAVSRKFP